MKYNYDFIMKRQNENVSKNEIREYIEDAKNGLHTFPEFEEAVKNLVGIVRILFTNYTEDFADEMIGLLQDALKLTQNREFINNLYFALTILYYKLGVSSKVVEYALLFENNNRGDSRQKASIYSFLTIILKETGFYELAYKYTEKNDSIAEDLTETQKQISEIASDNNRIYILVKMNRMEEAKAICEHMMGLAECYKDTDEVRLLIPSMMFTKMYVDVCTSPLQSATEYIELMNEVFNTGKVQKYVNKSIEPHLEILKVIHDSGVADVFQIAYTMLSDYNFIGDRYELCRFLLQLYEENPSRLSMQDYIELLRKFADYAKRSADNFNEVLHSLIQQTFQINEFKSQLVEIKDTYEKDPLTKVYNRSHLDRECAHYFEENQKGSMVFIDLNKFKSINDTYGHIAGDATLKRFGEIMINNIPADVKVFRYGGDEFLLLSPYSYEKMNQLIEYIHELYTKEFIFKDMKIKNDFSYGIVENNNQTFDELLHQVDLLMYQNKSGS